MSFMPHLNLEWLGKYTDRLLYFDLSCGVVGSASSRCPQIHRLRGGEALTWPSDNGRVPPSAQAREVGDNGHDQPIV